ncbi:MULTISPECIES: FAD-dependent monooxygenase [Brenneria]|uniref:Salicylate hydroxylase n=1 Tax=Brenneria nigrifluens DSM 30175 = ATCC 13028 TaxID=1121120 RepID=A0A2U1UFM5_9GAMM|nr:MULTISPECIES: FAD-dependent monooxygenase [Brenneria]EHD19981.1 monooxygenase FAD-binding [Brenneria sp. EniD312]PWC20374.1 salicylate hydroxylase [Brenneria nigrifluens] [Brenneria nigrifluens DSM 30175 = ATCC 13028]QCR03221.1 salicylate hydroxylase [Brenneria nigrifluens] [Brenneria nigrifluens DSM 30175 = ATCC 13028]
MNTDTITTVPSEITIVGGSLAGLTLALACASRGVSVRIVERAVGHRHGGDSLSIDLDAVAATVGHDPRAQPVLPVVPAYRELTTWPALYAWLRDRVAATPGIVLEEGRAVASVTDLGDRARIVFADGTERITAAVIGADGYRSVVRRAISPEGPFARYAGYLVWRGLVEERALARPVPWPSDGGLWIEFVDGYRLVAATLPGRDGSVEAGRRQITFAWFDVHRDELLRRTGCLTADGHIVGTLGRGMIENKVREELAALAPRLWPAAWAEAVAAGVRSSAVLSGAPIAEYQPPRLARGALAVVGDAAHVVSPMTGRGYLTGVEDAAVLARILASRKTAEPIAAAFARYEAARLPYVRGLVAHSSRISAEYRHYAESNGSGLPTDE